MHGLAHAAIHFICVAGVSRLADWRDECGGHRHVHLCGAGELPRACRMATPAHTTALATITGHKKTSASPAPLTCLPPPMLPAAGYPARKHRSGIPPCNEASDAPMLPAVQILTFVLLFLLSFSGFLVSDVPVYFR